MLTIVNSPDYTCVISYTVRSDPSQWGLGMPSKRGICHPGGNAIRMYGGCAIPLRVVIICQKLVWIDLKLKVKWWDGKKHVEKHSLANLQQPFPVYIVHLQLHLVYYCFLCCWRREPQWKVAQYNKVLYYLINFSRSTASFSFMCKSLVRWMGCFVKIIICKTNIDCHQVFLKKLSICYSNQRPPWDAFCHVLNILCDNVSWYLFLFIYSWALSFSFQNKRLIDSFLVDIIIMLHHIIETTFGKVQMQIKP